MTALSDTIQIALQYGLPGATILFAALWITWRSFWAALGWLWSVITKALPPLKWSSAVWIALGGCLLCAFSAPITAGLETLEYTYFDPVRVGQYTASEEMKIRIYENEIRRHTTPQEFQTVRDSTAAIAARIGSTPLAIYETAYLECGLNPFRVRDDRVAAGWIQFTAAGCKGLGITKEQVIAACQRRDAAFIMDYTGRYLARKADRLPAGATLRNTIDLYLAVFAPAHIGADENKVVYAGFQNPAYFKNAGLDGWKVDSAGRIVRGARDGKITAFEIYLCLERKKALLLKDK